METYANTPTYSDRGTVTTVFSRRAQRTTISFETQFVRAKRFRFECSRDRAVRGLADHYLVCSDFTHTYSEWSVRPGVIDDGPHLAGALWAAAGVSGGSSLTISGMLMPAIVGGIGATRLRSPEMDGTESVDGHPCWRIKGTSRGDPQTLWIDRSSYVIRRIVTKGHVATSDVETTVAFDPARGHPIDVASLQPPDLSATPPVARKPLAFPWIGILPEGITTKIRAVVPGSPADRSGLKAGDTIVALNGQPVDSLVELMEGLKHAGIGAHVSVTVVRQTAKRDLALTSESSPSVGNFAHDVLINKRAPAFDLPVIAGGGSARLASLEGNVVIVDFWSSYCPGCAWWVPHLDDLARRYPALRIIGVSSNEPDDIRQYALDYHVAYTLASDPGEDVATSYWHAALVVIDKAGIVRYVQGKAGDTSQLDAVIDKLLR